MEYTKIIQKGPPDFYYIKASLEFEDGAGVDLTVVEVKGAIMQALKKLHGLVGRATQVDILKYNERRKEFILRVPASGFSQLRTALALFGEHCGYCCAFRVHQVSAHLMALAVNSRQDVFHPVTAAS